MAGQPKKQTRKKDRELAWEKARELATAHAFEQEATPHDERPKAAERFMARMRKARSERDRERGKGKLKDEFEKKRGRDDGWER